MTSTFNPQPDAPSPAVADLVLVRSMRVAVILAAFLPLVALANEPEMKAPISSADVREVCKVIASDANEPIARILSVLSEVYVPGVAPEQQLVNLPNGKEKTITVYPRRDRVQVYTSCSSCGGGVYGHVYQVQKSHDQWRIAKKSRIRD